MGRRERVKIVLEFIGDKSFREEIPLWIFEYFINCRNFIGSLAVIWLKSLSIKGSPVLFYEINGLGVGKFV